jgi:hypothetical protein
MMTLISGPVIARLFLRTRKWAHAEMRRGSFGPVTEGPGGVLYARVADVEAYAGMNFVAAQIALAAGGVPGRLIHITNEEAA